jgi:hypothetical protein
MGLFIGWTVLSIAIGCVARARGDTFLVGFLSSMALSPLVGFALTMLRLPVATDSRRSHSL